VKKLTLLVSLLISAWAAIPAHAQLFGSGIVFDPTQSAHAISQIREAQQLYTTASQTRDQVIQSYNLARQMAQMPQDLYRRYAAEFSRWTTLSAANTYGNTADWVVAANTGAHDRASAAISRAGIPLVANPVATLSSMGSDAQATVKSQVATAELADGVSTDTLVTLGQIRARSQALNQQIATLERDTYSNAPEQQTEMAVLGKLNAASVMQLRAQQDTNQILSAAALNQMLAAKEQFDQQKRAINQAVYFQQNFVDATNKVTSGMAQSIGSISFSTRR
jgi:hypothetical protein